MNNKNKFSVTLNSGAAALAQGASLFNFPKIVRNYTAPANIYSSTSTDDSESKTFWSVAFLHAAILGAIFLVPHKQVEVPMLSFTVSTMDFATAPSTVANAASAPNTPTTAVTEDETKTEAVITKEETFKTEMHQDKKKEVKKAAAKPASFNSPKTNAPQAVSSEAQTAVISNDEPASYNAAYLKNSAPTYPPLARRMGEEGKIMLSVYVNAAGLPEKIELKQSSGFSRLDDAALDTVKTWRFAAAKQKGTIVASWVQVPIDFILEK